MFVRAPRVAFAAVFLMACRIGLADQPPLLNLDSSSLSAGAMSVGAQGFQLSHLHRGVSASGASRVASPFGWALNADPAAVDEVGSRMFGPVDLVTGAVSYADTQLVLPAYAPWPIGISYNSAQTDAHVGGGMQGKNWFQGSQPSITAPDSSGVIRLFYAANAFVEYKQVDSTSYYAGVNGAGGVISKETATFASEAVEVYRLLDQAGSSIVFFGFESQLNSSGAKGQIWKYTVCDGTTSSAQPTAYVGNSSKPLTAADDGYVNGHIHRAWDSADRRYDYDYAVVAGKDRLISVTAKTSGGSPTTIATVEYAYYGQTGITTGDNGAAGDLAMVRITLPTSFPAAGSDPVISDVRENRFYYDSDSRLKLVLGYEGTRRHVVNTGNSPVAWNANATTLGTALNSLAELRVTYASGNPAQVASAWFAGMDGNNDQPGGEHQFTFEDNGTYTPTTPWETRAMVRLPAIKRYLDSVLTATMIEAKNSPWMTQYFDELGQPLHSVVSTTNPADTVDVKYWVTGVVRDSSHRLKAVHTPENCSGYDHTATSNSRGSYATSDNTGVVTYYEREGSGAGLDGLVSGVRRGAGKSTGGTYAGTKYVSWTELAFHEQTLSSGTPTVKVRRPKVVSTRVYPTATTDHTTSGSYNTTSYIYTPWANPLVVRGVETTLPAVTASNNGSGVSNTRKTWFNHFGQPIVTRMPNERLDTIEHDATTGLVVKQTTDAATPTSTNFTEHGDLPTSGDIPAQALIAGESTPYAVRTEYTHDVLGRVTQTVANAELSGSGGARTSRSYYTRLADRRLVRLDVPAVVAGSPTIYYGPVSASVVNHTGVIEESGLISLSSPTTRPTGGLPHFTTTSEPRTWLAEPGSTLAEIHLTQAAYHSGGSPALVTFSYLGTSPDGSRVVEARRYTEIPVSGSTPSGWLGVANSGGNSTTTHYDRTLTRYNGMGLVDREVDFTDTIDRYGFDAIGRVIRHDRGTNEGETGNNMRWIGSVVYDAVNYGTYTSGNLNVAGGNGRVTQVFQHPSGSFNGTGDMHSFIRYDGLGNAVNLWGDGGPFLASSVDNLGRVTAAAAFDGTYSSWNGATSAFSPTSSNAGSGRLRQRFAESFYDEMGRVFRHVNHAVNPANGATTTSTTPGDAVTTDRFYGKNGALKATIGASATQIARDRLCQPSAMTTFAVNWDPSLSQAQRNTALASGDFSNQIAVAQTNYYRDVRHRQVIATISAERGTAGVGSDGAVVTTGQPSTRGLLMDLPYSAPGGGWLEVQHDRSTGRLLFPTPTWSTSNLSLRVRTTEYDGLLLYPTATYDFGDPLRHETIPPAICCGGDCPDLFPTTSQTWPYVETELEYDPRYVWCKMTTTDFETGQRTTTTRGVNPAGQQVRSMRVRDRVPLTVVPALPTHIAPISVPTEDEGCCTSAEGIERTFDKGRLKLERMFMCTLAGDIEEFTPYEDTWPCANTCSKDTGYGYPDYYGPTEQMYPDFDGSPPNDNNKPLWVLKPVGESPDLGWKKAEDDGSDDADWFVYDYLGRKVRVYHHPYRKPSFGDGNAAPDYPFDITKYGPGGYPTEVIKPSGDHLRPFDHRFMRYDMLGRPIGIDHILGDFNLGSTLSYDDEMGFEYDKFGMLSAYKQRFKGMFMSGGGGCGSMPTDKWIVCGLEREGTPQETVVVKSHNVSPWQGPRIVKQTLPGGRALGMAYMPDPTGTSDATRFPDNLEKLLTEPQLNWALGRTTGLFEGTGSSPYVTPLAEYGYVGMSTPLRRFLPGAGGLGLEKWQGLLPKYVPNGDGLGGGPVLQRPLTDWRHRPGEDLWAPRLGSVATGVDENLALPTEGHRGIEWFGGSIVSMLDPATSPDFGLTGSTGSAPNPSPVPGFDINGRDEFFRRDCKNRTIYWLSGRASEYTRPSKGTVAAMDAAWLAGRVDAASSSKGEAAVGSYLDGVEELEMRWPDVPNQCTATGGNGGWLIAPDGKISLDHPLSPRQPGEETEWGNSKPYLGEETGACGVDVQSPNSRTGVGQRWLTPSGGGTPTQDPSGWPFGRLYDAAGNLKTDGRHFFDYDGSNRLVDVYQLDTLSPASPLVPARGTKLAHFEYDGLGRLVKSQYSHDGGSIDDKDTEWTPRDHLGRPIGIWRQAAPVGETPQCARAYQLFGYHSTGFRGTGYDAAGGILDCPAVRWRDADNDDETGEDGLEETLHYLQDFRGDVTALSDATGIVERVRYGPTGRPETFPIADINFDGVVDTADQDAMDASIDAYDTDNADYDPRADLNRDGVVNAKDAELFDASYGEFAGPGNQWKLSQGSGITPGKAADGYDNRFGWRGYWYDGYLQKYHVRHRVYDPRQGRWMQTDPLGFDAGDQDLYRYAGGEYSTGYDPLGLVSGAGESGTFGGDSDGCGCEEPDGSSTAPYRIYPGQEGQDILRKVYGQSGAVHVVLYRSNGSQAHGIINNNQGGVFTKTDPTTEGLVDTYLADRAAGASNMTAPARQLRRTAETLVIAEEIAVRTVFIPVDVVWGAVEIAQNPGEPLNYLSVLPLVGKVAKVRAIIKDSKGVTRAVEMETEVAAKIENGQAKLVQEGEQLVVKEGDNVLATGGNVVEECDLIARTEANSTKGWKLGDPINNLTAKGAVPSWSAVRARFWKNEALRNAGTYTEENLARMRAGRAPQRINPITQRIESMELHHTPAQRDGGLFDVVPVWPDDHATVDPFRRTGN